MCDLCLHPDSIMGAVEWSIVLMQPHQAVEARSTAEDKLSGLIKPAHTHVPSRPKSATCIRSLPLRACVLPFAISFRAYLPALSTATLTRPERLECLMGVRSVSGSAMARSVAFFSMMP